MYQQRTNYLQITTKFYTIQITHTQGISLSWVQPGIQLTYRRYAVDWDVLEQLIITQVTDSTVTLTNRRWYVSGWSLYPFQDRLVPTRTYALDRQTGQAIEGELHPFYNRVWLQPAIREDDQLVFPIRHQNPSELVFTVTGQECRILDVHQIPCWCFEATYQHEGYRCWYDQKYGLRIRVEARTRFSQDKYSTHRVWQLQQLTHLSWN